MGGPGPPVGQARALPPAAAVEVAVHVRRGFLPDLHRVRDQRRARASRLSRCSVSCGSRRRQQPVPAGLSTDPLQRLRRDPGTLRLARSASCSARCRPRWSAPLGHRRTCAPRVPGGQHEPLCPQPLGHRQAFHQRTVVLDRHLCDPQISAPILLSSTAAMPLARWGKQLVSYDDTVWSITEGVMGVPTGTAPVQTDAPEWPMVLPGCRKPQCGRGADRGRDRRGHARSGR